MTVGFVSNQTVNTGNSRSSASFSHTYPTDPTSNRIVLVCTKTRATSADRTSTAITYGGSAMTAATGGAWTNEYAAGVYHTEKWWWVLAPASNSNYTVDVTYGGSTASDQVFVITAYNVNTAAPVGATNVATGSGATLSVDLTSTVADSAIIGGGMMRRASGEDYSVGGGTILRADGQTGTAAQTDFTYADLTLGSPTIGVYTLTTTNATSSVQWLIGAIEIVPAAGVGVGDVLGSRVFGAIVR